eukprot:1195220-Prorocentrum_minimum.AAC.2
MDSCFGRGRGISSSGGRLSAAQPEGDGLMFWQTWTGGRRSWPSPTSPEVGCPCAWTTRRCRHYLQTHPSIASPYRRSGMNGWFQDQTKARWRRGRQGSWRSVAESSPDWLQLLREGGASRLRRVPQHLPLAVTRCGPHPHGRPLPPSGGGFFLRWVASTHARNLRKPITGARVTGRHLFSTNAPVRANARGAWETLKFETRRAGARGHRKMLNNTSPSKERYDIGQARRY